MRKVSSTKQWRPARPYAFSCCALCTAVDKDGCATCEGDAREECGVRGCRVLGSCLELSWKAVRLPQHSGKPRPCLAYGIRPCLRHSQAPTTRPCLINADHETTGFHVKCPSSSRTASRSFTELRQRQPGEVGELGLAIRHTVDDPCLTSVLEEYSHVVGGRAWKYPHRKGGYHRGHTNQKQAPPMQCEYFEDLRSPNR